jgi:hypothetical protein
MSRILNKYLNQIIVYADRSEPDSVKIRAELEDHLLKKISDLESEGMSREDAVLSAIEDHGHPKTVGYGLRKHRWIDVRTQGTARGFIAVGPKAVGTVAIGGVAVGLFSCGIVGVGLISFSIVGIALLYCYGTILALAPLGLAHGSIAVGFMAAGFWSCGIVSAGNVTFGLRIHSYDQYLPHYTARGSQALVYACALVRLYVGAFGSLATSFIVHTMIFGAVATAGLALYCRCLKSEQNRIGYTLLKF